MIIEELPWKDYRKVLLSDPRLCEGRVFYCWRGDGIAVVGQPAGGGEPLRASIRMVWSRRRNMARLREVLREVYGAAEAELPPPLRHLEQDRARGRRRRAS